PRMLHSAKCSALPLACGSSGKHQPQLPQDSIVQFPRNLLEGDRLRSGLCWKDCFNLRICWSFLASPSFSWAPRSSQSWAKVSVKAFVGSNPRLKRKKANPQQRFLLPTIRRYVRSKLRVCDRETVAKEREKWLSE